MRLLRLLSATMLLFVTTVAMAFEPSTDIVVVDGKKYYVHTVEPGQTIYSLSRSYGVTEQQLLECNKNLSAETLRAGEKIYVPVKESSKRDKKRRNTASDIDNRTFRIHIVESGQTLYSIAKSHKISLAIIEQDNPEVSAETLSVGTQLRIRRSEMGLASTHEIEREISERTSGNVEVADAGEHVVLPGETIYSLSRRYNISEGELLSLNNMTNASELRAGMVIRVNVRNSDSTKDDVVTKEPQIIDSLMGRDEANMYLYGEDTLADSLATEQVQVEFIRLGANNTLKAALMLPFHMRGKVNPNYVDFYRGVLLAMEDLKAEGYSVELSVFDTENSAARIKDIVSYEDGVLDAQLIIGPVHIDELRHVLGHAEDNNIPVVSPLADIEGINSPVLFQMQSEDDYKNTKYREFVEGDRELIMIYASTNDTAYIEEIRALAGDKHIRSINFSFNREPFFHERKSDGTRGALIDIKALIRSNTEKTFIVVADKDTDIDRILTTLASTKSSIVDRGAIIGDYVVLGNRKWTRLENIERQSFFRNNVAMIVPYHAKRSDFTIRSFDGRYIQAYKTLPTMFSYRGYDAAMIFCKRMFTGFDNITTESVTPLTTTYRFEKIDDTYVNTEWSLELYKPNFTIEKR